MLTGLRGRERSLCSFMLAGFVLLLGGEERGCVLSHVGWSVHAASKEEAKREVEKWLARPFYVAPGRWPRQNGISHSHWVKICDDHNSQINLRAKQKYEVLSATPIFLFRHTVKEFQVLLFNTNNSIQKYSFVCTQLNDSKYYYLSLTIQLNISHLFKHS